MPKKSLRLRFRSFLSQLVAGVGDMDEAFEPDGHHDEADDAEGFACDAHDVTLKREWHELADQAQDLPGPDEHPSDEPEPDVTLLQDLGPCERVQLTGAAQGRVRQTPVGCPHGRSPFGRGGCQVCRGFLGRRQSKA